MPVLTNNISSVFQYITLPVSKDLGWKQNMDFQDFSYHNHYLEANADQAYNYIVREGFFFCFALCFNFYFFLSREEGGFDKQHVPEQEIILAGKNNCQCRHQNKDEML